MRTIRHPVGYTLPVLRDRLTQLVYDPDTDTTTPTPWNLNDPSIDHVQLVLSDDDVTVLSAQMTVEPGVEGDISYAWQPADVTTAARVGAIEQVHMASGGVQAAPAFLIEFYDPLEAAEVGESPLCQPWVDTAGLACATADGIETYAQLASELLYMASGQRYAGVCAISVRPCPGLCGCWQDECLECATPCNVVRLPMPVREVTSVMIGGEALDPAAYRVYDHRLLQRIDGLAWPPQALSYPPGSQYSWEVNLTTGTPPPLAGVVAAGDAACYLAGLYSEWDCKLPAHIRSLARQGINQVFDDRVVSLYALPSVMLFLREYGTLSPTVWSPDMQPDVAEVL